jgi:hypothetical protein
MVSSNHRSAILTIANCGLAEPEASTTSRFRGEVPIGTPPPLLVSFSLFSVKPTRGHDVAAIFGTLGPADGEAELQCRANLRDVK